MGCSRRALFPIAYMSISLQCAGPTPVYPAPPNMYMPQALSPLAFMLDARGIPRGPAGPLPGYPPEGPTAQTRFFNVRNQNWRPQAGSMQVQAQAPEQPHFQAMGSAQPYQLEAGHEWSPSASSSSRLQAENPLSRVGSSLFLGMLAIVFESWCSASAATQTMLKALQQSVLARICISDGSGIYLFASESV